MEKLKRCPFCGSSLVEVNKFGPGMCRIRCSVCQCGTALRDKDTAVAEWNTRRGSGPVEKPESRSGYKPWQRLVYL